MAARGVQALLLDERERAPERDAHTARVHAPPGSQRCSGLIDNRPFLRCLHGVGLCAWRLGNAREAAAVFRKMLWLIPNDNQGARFNLAAVEAGMTWEEMEGEAASQLRSAPGEVTLMANGARRNS